MSRDSSAFEDAGAALDPKLMLLEAAKAGDVKLLNDMLKKNGPFEKDVLSAAIDKAVEAGHPKVIAEFKKHISDMIKKDPMTELTATTSEPSKPPLFPEYPSPLSPYEDLSRKIDSHFFEAAKSGNMSLFSEMLKEIPELATAKDKDGKTALHYAAEGEQKEILSALVEKDKAALNVRDNSGRMPIHYAAEAGNREIFTMLENAGAMTTVAILVDGKLPENGENPEQILVAAEKKQSFLDAARKGPKETFDKMLEENPNLAAAKAKDGKTALHLAAEGGQKEILTELLKHKDASAMAQAKDNLGRTPLHYAAENGQKEMCDALIESASKGETPEQKEAKQKEYVAQQDVAGRTADHLAANNWHNTKTKMERLGEQGIQDKGNLNAGDLARAAVYRADIMKGKTGDKLDIKRPELLTIPDRDGKTALHFAAQHQNQEALDQILQHKNVQEAINDPDKSGKTPLIYAAETGNQALYETLVKAGANKEFQHDGKTAEAILAEAAKRAEEERARKEREASAPPDLLAKMTAQAPKAAGSDPKDKPLSQEDFFAGHVERLPYQPGEPCKNGEDKFKFDPQTRTTSRAMSDPTKSHVMETANPDGSFKYDVKTVAPDDSPTKIHKIEGDFGTLYFDAKGAMIGAELSPDLEKLKKLDPAQLAEAQKIQQAKLEREAQTRSSGVKASSIDAAEITRTTERTSQIDLDDSSRDSNVSSRDSDASTERSSTSSIRNSLSSDRGSSIEVPIPKGVSVSGSKGKGR